MKNVSALRVFIQLCLFIMAYFVFNMGFQSEQPIFGDTYPSASTPSAEPMTLTPTGGFPSSPENIEDKSVNPSYLKDGKVPTTPPQKAITNRVRPFYLKEDTRAYFQQYGDHICFLQGINATATAKGTSCVCAVDYRGDDCGIPLSVFENLSPSISLRRRNMPRRVVNAFNFNHEIDLLEARLNELNDVVDVFVICESNSTCHGDPKPLILAEQMKNNLNVMKFNSQIMYILLDDLPSVTENTGWFIDRYIRIYMGEQSLPKLKNIRDDDLVVLDDADELPSREVLLFLKLYDGYPEPIKLSMWWTVYGFFWVNKEPEVITPGSVVTFGMLNDVFKGNIFTMRAIDSIDSSAELIEGYQAYKKKVDHPLGWWTVGSPENPAGFHCSWCFNPEGIRLKLVSAQKDDGPRWGNYPDKRDLQYIRRLRESGAWFDGTYPFSRTYQNQTGRSYCPKYIAENPDRFMHLIEIP